jgi:hypothetical protein
MLASTTDYGAGKNANADLYATGRISVVRFLPIFAKLVILNYFTAKEYFRV